MKRRNIIAADLRSVKYRKRVVQDKTKYTRKLKHKCILKPRPPSRGFDLKSGLVREVRNVRAGLRRFLGAGMVIACRQGQACKNIEGTH